jgi:hypothetical protein
MERRYYINDFTWSEKRLAGLLMYYWYRKQEIHMEFWFQYIYLLGNQQYVKEQHKKYLFEKYVLKTWTGWGYGPVNEPCDQISKYVKPVKSTVWRGINSCLLEADACQLCKMNAFFFNVHGSVHRNNFLIYIQQDATLHSLFYPKTASHVSGGTTTHHQERKQLYLQHLVFVTSSLLPVSIVECAVGGVNHPQHTQTSSNFSTIAAGSSNGVKNTRCCR